MFEDTNTVIIANASGYSLNMMQQVFPMLQVIYKLQGELKFANSLEYIVLRATSNTNTTNNININVKSFCYSGPNCGQSRRGLRPCSLLNPYTMKNVNKIKDVDFLAYYSINFLKTNTNNSNENCIVLSNASSNSYSFEETMRIIEYFQHKMNINENNITNAKKNLQHCENERYLNNKYKQDCNCLQPHYLSIVCDKISSSQYADAVIYCDYKCDFPCSNKMHLACDASFVLGNADSDSEYVFV
jgi:hypothetical protein